jgi:hypothetical protein
VKIIVSLRGYQIDISLTLPDDLRNFNLSGLFGNFNGNPEDDLFSANGTQLAANATEEIIYGRFGETCKFS